TTALWDAGSAALLISEDLARSHSFCITPDDNVLLKGPFGQAQHLLGTTQVTITIGHVAATVEDPRTHPFPESVGAREHARAAAELEGEVQQQTAHVGKEAPACLISAVVTLPFDVVKTHKQIELGEMEIMKERRSTSTFTIMRDLYQSRGVKGLFSGIVPRISKVAPACAVMISIYEFGKKFFRQKNAARRSAGVL
ncbi:hypothetical protein HPB47_022974, partial [Ixodes persulcatus]